MGLETGTFIDDLVPTNPLGTDPKSQGDDHVRLIKSILQSQFPNLGQEAVTLTAAEINSLGLYTAGTWTAAMEDSSLNQSSVSVTGNWVRQGNLVTCWFNDMDAIDVTGLNTVDSARITIPFPRDITGGLPSGACVLDQVVLTGGHTWANAYMTGTAGGRMQIRESGSGDSDAAILISAFSGNDIKGVTLTYMAEPV